MIKGHAVIELKDERTGKVQTIEHDNMVTNGLKYFMMPWLGKFNYASQGSTPQVLVTDDVTKRKNNNKSMMNHLLGGIFLFEDNLTEDADNVVFPNDNVLTGKGSWDAYTGMDISRGSYNDDESGLQADGSYRHVWDFSTNQANGKISALALTTYTGGICGDGYADWDFTTQTKIDASPLIGLNNILLDSQISTYFAPFCLPDKNEIYYMKDSYNMYYQAAYADQHFTRTGKLSLIRKKMPLTKISLFYDYYNQYISDGVDITVPTEFIDYVGDAPCISKNSENYVYVFISASIKAGGTFKLLRIRKTDLTTDVVTLTNSTDYELSTSRYYITLTDKYLYIQGTGAEGDGYLYRIDINNNSLELIGRPHTSACYLYNINGYVYAVYYRTNSSYYNTFCINEKTLAIKKHPYHTFPWSAYQTFLGVEKIAKNAYLIIYGSNSFASDITAQIALLSNTLMTINNLASPVIKTATQSMKVTYTLTETEN